MFYVVINLKLFSPKVALNYIFGNVMIFEGREQ